MSRAFQIWCALVLAELGRVGQMALDLGLVARLVVRTELGRIGQMALDLGLVAWLVVRTELGRIGQMTLELGLLVLALLLGHCSSFRSCCASCRRCQHSRRARADESSHRLFKFATGPAILRRMGRFAAELHAFGRVFANPRVRNVQLAGAGATLSAWAYGVALPVYAYHAGGARAVGVLFFARFVLAALASPWLGLLADRWSRRRVMLTSDLLRCGTMAGMTVVASAGGNAYAVYVLASISTLIAAAWAPAQAALMPSLVNSPEELTAANVVENTISSVGMFAGPALGGVLLALSGPAAVFALAGALALWSAAFIIRVPRDQPPEPVERQHFLAELTAGFATVARRPALRVVIGLSAALALVEGALEVLLVVLALRLLHGGNGSLGWLNTAIGIGSLAGAFVVAVLATRRRLAGGFAIGLLLSALPLVATAAVSSLAPALVLMGVLGVGGVFCQVNSMTLLQRSTENEVMGRVFAVLDEPDPGRAGDRLARYSRPRQLARPSRRADSDGSSRARAARLALAEPAEDRRRGHDRGGAARAAAANRDLRAAAGAGARAPRGRGHSHLGRCRRARSSSRAARSATTSMP